MRAADRRGIGRRGRVATGGLGVALVLGGGTAIVLASASQHHAPQPASRAAGTTGPAYRGGVSARGRGASGDGAAAKEGAARPASTVVGPTLAPSAPIAVQIPAIGVSSDLQSLGLAATGSIAVPQPGPGYNEAAWFDGSPTPGAVGPSILEGHIDSAATGPSVFFRLGALVPGEHVDVTLADGTVAVFTVTGVRQYEKADFPTNVVYGNTNFAALRLITCGGAFDPTTGHYLANTVVFASLTSSHPSAGRATAPAASASAGTTGVAGDRAVIVAPRSAPPRRPH